MTLSIQQPDATVGEIAGHQVALRYAGVDAEYAALRRSAIVVDRSHRARMTFEGDKRAETLTGLVTNDVASLSSGAGLYAAALTPRGKIIADVRIFARNADLLVDVPVRAAQGWVGMVKKFVNPRATRYADRTESLANIGVFGTASRSIVAAITGVNQEDLGALQPFAHISFADASIVLRSPDLGLEGYELIVPASEKEKLWRSAIENGAAPAGIETWEIARIEAGRPEWGLDIDESTIPQEANLDELHAISYTKGCYTGQETVARVHFRGHVNRHLRGLTFDAAALVPRGAQLLDPSDKAVGDVRSVANSPRAGGIALAMVRREIEPATPVRVRWGESDETLATVVALPFAG
jgi:folate-binding protein YgfZ